MAKDKNYSGSCLDVTEKKDVTDEGSMFSDVKTVGSLKPEAGKKLERLNANFKPQKD